MKTPPTTTYPATMALGDVLDILAADIRNAVETGDTRGTSILADKRAQFAAVCTLLYGPGTSSEIINRLGLTPRSG